MAPASRSRSAQADPELHRQHTAAAIQERLALQPGASYLRDFVYGAIDGAVTTFAIVAGAAGANLGDTVVVILGVANLLADGLSMAVSNYLGTKAEREQRKLARRTEEAHVALVPEGEREEVRQLFAAKGFGGADLDRAVEVITADRDRWVDTMMTEELGYGVESANPMRAAASTFVAFVVVGAVPLLVFLLDAVTPGSISHRFVWSAGLTALAFGMVGALKARVVDQSRWRGALETLAVGGAAALVAFGVGVVLDGIA